MILLNDIHVGVQRKGGTTPKSREALREYLFNSLEALLANTDENHLVIVGDLFDEFEIESRDWVRTFSLLKQWMVRGRKLTLIAGNHDHQPKGAKVSDFQMLSIALQCDKLQVIDINQWTAVAPDVFALAHCANQDAFDKKLDEVLAAAGAGSIVLLHANFDNNFAAESDHSLNVSRQVAMKFKEKDVTLVFAHEHQARNALGGYVVVLGNQWPTSIADCLNNDKKFAHFIDGENCITPVETWSRLGTAGFAEIDWTELDTALLVESVRFIRITGNATSNQASDVLNAIAKYRLKSEAFVVTNGVKIEGIAAVGDLPETFDAIKAFDVMEFISQNVTPEEMVVINELKASL